MQSPIKTLGILGGKGMLGGDLARFFSSSGVAVDAIDRDNYESFKGKSYDALINANGNSKRFWANEHTLEDFAASTESVYRSLLDFEFGTYVYISSSDTYPDHRTPTTTKEDQAIDPALLSPYGFHKYLSEQIVRNRAKSFLIFRSSLILGSALKKGPIYDIVMGNQLFITLDSRLQAITTEAAGGAIEAVLESSAKNIIYNMGGRGVFPLSRAGEYFGKTPQVSLEAKTQEYEMDVSRLSTLYQLKTSEEYIRDFISEHHG